MDNITMNQIQDFLKLEQPMSQNPVRFSNIVLLLKAARKLTGRNIETGIYEMNEINEEDIVNGLYHSFQYVGLINYLILLEQLGSIFSPKQETICSSNGIFCALTDFSELEDELKVGAIVALRHSLTHKFGLATEKKKDRKKLQHKYILSIDRNSKIVEIPSNPWDGNYSDKSDGTSTTIFIKDLEELVENIYQTIKTMLDKNELIVKIDLDELYSRYTMTY
ncbi:hypothetical protein [Gaoshiqia sediminis]|uniref:Uncharacterized protein n=1 Tax=Gaoshiqia sediminis TaxID=2986998 RepID=A0AA41Y7T9_9BACT|nr:hypothetical protein [Gaoshiqia sediminis]MCW0483450.1 hypothetical protein [Gaoshiqia sediminis]